jgi:MFS transporter, DHA3 family, macrolide efflux protein
MIPIGNGAITIAGIPLGALLMSLTSISNMLLMDFVTMLMAVVPLFFIPIPKPASIKEKQTKSKKGSFFKEVKEGFNYIIGWPGLVMIIVMTMSINLLLSPAMSLLPLLVSEHFGGNEVQLALLNSIMGVGMLVGGLILSVWGGFKRRILTAYMGMVLSGLAILIVGLTPSHLFSLAAGAFGIAMLLLPMINGPIHAGTQA